MKLLCQQIHQNLLVGEEKYEYSKVVFISKFCSPWSDIIIIHWWYTRQEWTSLPWAEEWYGRAQCEQSSSDTMQAWVDTSQHTDCIDQDQVLPRCQYIVYILFPSPANLLSGGGW